MTNKSNFAIGAFKSLKKVPIPQEVEHQLREAMANGIYNPGDKLPSEKELVNQFQVSRSTIRTALRKLQSSALVIIKQGMNGGTYVSMLNPDPITENFKNLIRFNKINFSHLIDARLYIEPEAAGIAAIFRTDEDIEILKGILDKAKRNSQISALDARLTNVRFHCEVARLTKNPLITFITESIIKVYETSLIEMTRETVNKTRARKNIDSHRYILDAIIERNKEEAFKRAKQHIIDIYHMYCSLIPNIFDRDIEQVKRHMGFLRAPLKPL